MNKTKNLKTRFKLLAALFILGFISINAYAQKITVDFDRQPLKSVIQAIEKQSGRTFSYSNNLIENKTVSIHVKDATLKSVLRKIESETGLEYKIMSEDLIVVSAKKKIRIVYPEIHLHK